MLCVVNRPPAERLAGEVAACQRETTDRNVEDGGCAIVDPKHPAAVAVVCRWRWIITGSVDG